MKESLAALEQFIGNFNLRQPNGVVFFNATILFSSTGHTETVQSEVHVITSDNIGAVYFLDLANIELPDMLSVKKHLFSYTDKRCLKIDDGEYNITIYPVQ